MKQLVVVGFYFFFHFFFLLKKPKTLISKAVLKLLQGNLIAFHIQANGGVWPFDIMFLVRPYWLKNMEKPLWSWGCEWHCAWFSIFPFLKKMCVWEWRSAISKAGSDFVCLCLWEKWANPHLGKWSLLKWSFQNHQLRLFMLIKRLI